MPYEEGQLPSPRLTTDALLISSNEQLVELLVLPGRVEYDNAKFKAASVKNTRDVSVIFKSLKVMSRNLLQLYVVIAE